MNEIAKRIKREIKVRNSTISINQNQFCWMTLWFDSICLLAK